jgi:hypothetical protein
MMTRHAPDRQGRAMYEGYRSWVKINSVELGATGSGQGQVAAVL